MHYQNQARQMMLKNNLIYLDNAATTLPKEEIMTLFNKIEMNVFGNPNSIHHLGIEANTYLNKARDIILSTLGCKNHRVVFLSSATEANNLAIKGYCLKYKNRGRHIITTNIEHPSVLECFKQLEEQFGFEVTVLKVDESGKIKLKDVKNAIKTNTILVSIMAINNEIGSINDIKSIANIVHDFPKAMLHVDVTQAIGKIDLPYNEIDMFSFSGHKLHGIKGSGALIAKKNISFLPVISGGGQEDGFRSGTQSVALAVSLAKCVQLECNNLNKKICQIAELNSYVRSSLSKINGIAFNSDEKCSPFILNFSLTNKKASVVVEALSRKNIFVSSVSACHSKKEPISEVVMALKNDPVLAANTIRLSFDEDVSHADIDTFIKELTYILEKIR
ncbi:MAG TPA: cysteine desulfurase NifS [Firmicutes bacterium]|nr:cysteine desulfurase NifS [Bacillota bacterium]